MWGRDLDFAYDSLKDEIGKEDVVVIMGAGDISGLAEKLVTS
jgi:UDP-N-acetylmuramate-alanine ligase